MATLSVLILLAATAIACDFSCIEDESYLLHTCFSACRCDDECLPGCYNSCIRLADKNDDTDSLEKCHCDLEDDNDDSINIEDVDDLDELEQDEIVYDEEDGVFTYRPSEKTLKNLKHKNDKLRNEHENDEDDSGKNDQGDSGKNEQNDSVKNDQDDSGKNDQDDSSKNEQDDSEKTRIVLEFEGQGPTKVSESENDQDDSGKTQIVLEFEGQGPALVSVSKEPGSLQENIYFLTYTEYTQDAIFGFDDQSDEDDAAWPVSLPEEISSGEQEIPSEDNTGNTDAPNNPQTTPALDANIIPGSAPAGEPPAPTTELAQAPATGQPEAINILGGLGQPIPADQSIQLIANSLQGSVEAQLGATFSKFNVVSYQTQVVAGTNYMMKVEVDNGFINVKAFKSLPFAGETVDLVSVEDTRPYPLVTSPNIIPLVALSAEIIALPVAPADAAVPPVAVPVDAVEPLPVNTSSILGGFGEEIPADVEIQALADSIRSDVETQLGTSFSKYNVVSYTTQVVAGTNYDIKIEVDNRLIHVKAAKSLPHEGEIFSFVSVETVQPSVEETVIVGITAPTVALEVPAHHTQTIPSVDPIAGDTTTPISTPALPADRTPTDPAPIFISGGFTPERPADAEIQVIANSIKGDVEAQLLTTYTKFFVVSYSSQVVAGIKYRMKIEVDDGLILVEAFESLPYAGGLASLTSVIYESVTVQPETPIDPIAPIETPIDPIAPIENKLVPEQPAQTNISNIVGGYGEESSEVQQVQEIANTIKADIEAQLGTAYSIFNVVSFKTQVVAGTNYFMKIEVNNDYIHAKAFKSLPHEGSVVSLTSVVAGKSVNDPLDVNESTLASEPISPSPADTLPSTNLLGGFGEELLADQDSQLMAFFIQEAVESQLNTSYSKFNVISYRQQVVAGINYLMRIEVDNDLIHVEAFKPLASSQDGSGIILKAVESGKLIQDPLLPLTKVTEKTTPALTTMAPLLSIVGPPEAEAVTMSLQNPTSQNFALEYETHNENLAPPPPSWIDDIPIIPELKPAVVGAESNNVTFLPPSTDEVSNLATSLLSTTEFNENNCPCESFCSEFSSDDCIASCRERM